MIVSTSFATHCKGVVDHRLIFAHVVVNRLNALDRVTDGKFGDIGSTAALVISLRAVRLRSCIDQFRMPSGNNARSSFMPRENVLNGAVPCLTANT